MNAPIGEIHDLFYIMYKEKLEYNRIKELQEANKKKAEENVKAKRAKDYGIEPIMSEFPLPEGNQMNINNGLLGILGG